MRMLGRAVGVLFLALVGVGVVEGLGYCSSCKAVDCSFDTQCGVRCACVKLNGNYKGNCVAKW